jgi:predicted GH43/DUF377 family glycosyl hydrolase
MLQFRPEKAILLLGLFLLFIFVIFIVYFLVSTSHLLLFFFPDTTSGWQKYDANPVLGDELGTVFDCTVLKENEHYRMWFSWREKKSIALTESSDGIHWGYPEIVLSPTPDSNWETNVNRPVVLKKGNDYYMWYTGQTKNQSFIGYATSKDGRIWERMNHPVISPEGGWEKTSVMCPFVMYEAESLNYRMWYSGGDQFEPSAIGYASSKDGINWIKDRNNPIFRPSAEYNWENDRVSGAQVVKIDEWFIMFYIGFRDIHHAQIGLARSRNGISGWERHPANPIIRPGILLWDSDSVYKPFALLENDQWFLWYNGRKGNVEKIGLVTHKGKDLGFPPQTD